MSSRRSDPTDDPYETHARSTMKGKPVNRREDSALLRGTATFVDDYTPDDDVVLSFVRSEHAHARITSIDTSDADALAGVVGTYTWGDVETTPGTGRVQIETDPMDRTPPGHPVLAADKVRYQGQPVVAVVAEDRYTAGDAVEAVDIEYEVLDAVTDPVEATGEAAPALYEGVPDNTAVTKTAGDPETTERAFREAPHTVELDLWNNRLAPMPMEPRAAVAEWDDEAGGVTVRLTAQNPHQQQSNIAEGLGLPESDVQVIAPHVGGGFGQKDTLYPEGIVAGEVARRLRRPVKWTASRGSNILAGNHGRDNHATAKLAFDADGVIEGLEVETYSAVGGYALGAAATVLSQGYTVLLTGQYDVPAAYCETSVVFTNTAPVHTYRGGVVPEAIYVIERLINAAARVLDLDPATVRERNMVSPGEYPYETALGLVFDNGDFRTPFSIVQDAVSAAAEEPTGEGDEVVRGVGYGAYLEVMPAAYETGVVRVSPDGSVTVLAGSHSHGQGHETTYAQIVSDELGVPYGAIDVVEGDTDRIPSGNGTWGSRSTIAGGNAVAESAREVSEKVHRLAAHRFECDPADVEIENGRVKDRTTPGNTCPFAEIAAMAHGHGRPADVPPGLEATTFYEPDGLTFTFGSHAAIVDVDTSTGEYELVEYVAADDCGERINPQIVEGQIQGSVVQGIGQATLEVADYASDGTLRTRTMAEYALPRAEHAPDVDVHESVTPASTNELGVKGVGEVGTVAAPPAVVNAILNAVGTPEPDPVDMPVRDADVRDLGDQAE